MVSAFPKPETLPTLTVALAPPELPDPLPPLPPVLAPVFEDDPQAARSAAHSASSVIASSGRVTALGVGCFVGTGLLNINVG